MITRIAATRVSSAAPTSNRSKSRATMQHHTKVTKAATTTIPAGQPITMVHTTAKRTTTTSTAICRCSLAALQVLVFACALPPPLQPQMPVLLPPRCSFAVEALPITSKPIESTAENLAWQAWLMLPPEQKQLEKSRKVTPKSIFTLPFRDCPPGHQLFQSACIPTVNINQSELLAQQVLGLFVGNEAGGVGAGGNENAYEFDYDDEYGLGYGGGESVAMHAQLEPFSGGSAAGLEDAQQPPIRDEPLKFNLFEQKYPTNDYEADISSSAMEGSGSARPLTEMVPSNISEGDRVEVTGNDSDAGANILNSPQFLDTVQGFIQRHATASSDSGANTTVPSLTNIDNNNRTANENSSNLQGLSDLLATSSNISAFTVGDIDAIILPAENSLKSATTVASVGSGGGVDAATGTNLEPQRISLFKDDSSVHLVTTLIAQSDSDRRTGGRDPITGDGGDLVAAAQQQQNIIAHFLSADALLPLSSVAPYLTTTTPKISADDADHATKTALPVAKDEHPRSVTQLNSAATQENTDAQETSFITTTEPEDTTSFQIDETTVIEAIDENDTSSEGVSLLDAILKQQRLELQKLKVEPVEDVVRITTTTIVTAIKEETTTAGDDTTTETKIIANKADATTTVKPANEVNEKPVEAAAQIETTTQPLPSAVALPSTITATATAKPTLAATSSTDRFRNTPAAAVTAIRITALASTTHKPVSAIVTSAAPQTDDNTAGEETAASSNIVVSDVTRSGDNDLVNAAASSTTSDPNNDNNNTKNNKKSPARSVAAEEAAAVIEKNIEQELRMINDLVKGRRQLAAMKMAAIKTTKSTSDSNEPELVVKKFANAAENDRNASGGEAVEVEVWRIADEPTTTQVAATVVKSPLNRSSGSASEILQTTTTTAGATQPQAISKMESSSSSQPAETTAVENYKTAETASKIAELATTTTTEPDFETAAKAASAEETGATLWSRIMPLFGFGGAVVGAASTSIPAATTVVPATKEIAESALINSISSNRSVSDMRKSSSSSLSDINSISVHNNNNNIISNKSSFESHSRRNSKIIRIDQLSDVGVAAAATTNTKEEPIEINTATTKITTTKTTSKANAVTEKFAVVPEQEQKDSAEQSAYWWLPASWRAHRGTSEEGQPLLFRLWSAFPESQLKTKVRT